MSFNCVIPSFHSSQISIQCWQWWVHHSQFINIQECFCLMLISSFWVCCFNIQFFAWSLALGHKRCVCALFKDFALTKLLYYAFTRLTSGFFLVGCERHLLALTCHGLVPNYIKKKPVNLSSFWVEEDNILILFSCILDFVCKSSSLPGYGRNGIQRVRQQWTQHD